jgi:hypothetical protein
MEEIMTDEATPVVEEEVQETPAEEVVAEATTEKGGEAGDTPTPEEAGEQGLSESAQEKVNERINQLTKKRRVAEQDAAFWRDKALNNVASPEKGEAPKEDDYENYENYLDARAEWKAEQTYTRLRQQESKDVVKSEEERITQRREEDWTKKVNEARTKFKDFDSVALSENVPYSDSMRDLVKDSDVGPELAMYFGKNPEVAEKVAYMTDLQAAKAIGMIEHQLSTPVSPKNVSRAPEPITPVGGGGQEAGQKDPDDMSTEEWLEHRKKTKNIK